MSFTELESRVTRTFQVKSDTIITITPIPKVQNEFVVNWEHPDGFIYGDCEQMSIDQIFEEFGIKMRLV